MSQGSAKSKTILYDDQGNPVLIVDGKISTMSFDNTQKKLYDIGASVIYIGTAPQGSASSAPVWLIKKTTLDVDGNPESTLWSSSTAIWDNRGSETYQ